MTRRDLADLLLLGALWGASFLFMRMGAADFGPVALVLVRVAGASVVLLPLLAWRGEMAALRRNWRTIAVVGIVNSALPFLLFMIAALVLGVGLMSVLNATVPIWGALVARLWLGEKLDAGRWLGLAIGLAGVAALSWGKADFQPGEHGVSAFWGIAACLVASVLYGIAANFSRRFLADVPSMAVAAGSQTAAALAMLLPAWWTWPRRQPRRQRLGRRRGAGHRLHRAGLRAVLPPHRPCRRGQSDIGHLPHPRLCDVVGLALPGRSAHRGDAGWRRRDSGRHRAGHWRHPAAGSAWPCAMTRAAVSPGRPFVSTRRVAT